MHTPGGCDGTVNVWDGTNKKRLINYTGYPTSIASVAFNRDGTLLAIASSYTYEEGERDHPSDAIYVREVNANDVKPKPRKPAA
jgi:cell cycle arrest protein BUB3